MEKDIIEGLDPLQKEAVLSPARSVLVVAPPGSGKTRVLVARFIRLLDCGHGGITALTFTNRAAREMKERVAGATGLMPSTLNIGTFHSLCYRILRRERPEFTLYTREDQIELLKELGVNAPSKAVEEISRSKNLAFAGRGQDADRELLRTYKEAMKKRDALDLDDLILEAIALFEGNEDVLARYRKALGPVLVDEYQDINPPQARFLRTLVGTDGSIFAIGDPDQSIYAFRGANLEGFLNFKRDFPGAEVYYLKKNYRSRERIVRAAGTLIENNLRSEGSTQSPVRSGGEVVVLTLRDEKEEASFIVKEIESLMGGLTSLTVSGIGVDMSFSDFAVLFRTNRQADAVMAAFSDSSIPFRVAGTANRDLMEFIGGLKKVEPPANISLSGFVMHEAVRSGLSEDLASALSQRAALYDGLDIKDALEAFSEEFMLADMHEDCDIRADRVTLMTLHMAKGLEFSVVFIAGCEEGILPLERGGRVEDVEEERRLFYVGMTRAKERLYLLSACRRRQRGVLKDMRVSRFVGELPGELVTRRTVERKARRRAFQKGLFD